jgi:hypothetical protein
LDVAKVKSMANIFTDYDNFDPSEISSWDVSSVENFKYMFSYYDTMDILDLSKLNFVGGTNYSYMFAHYNSTDRKLKVIDVSGSDWNEHAVVDGMFRNLDNVTIYVKDERAKAFIEAQAPDCTVLIKDKE